MRDEDICGDSHISASVGELKMSIHWNKGYREETMRGITMTNKRDKKNEKRLSLSG